MSAQSDGPQCQNHQMSSLKDLKPNYSIKFINADNEDVGTMDFNGAGLAFEGNAEVSAIVFMDYVSKAFSERLKSERNKVREECIKILENAPEPDGIDCAEHIRKEIER